MQRIYAIVVCLVVLVFAAGFATPAEDSPATAYDESDTQPYECAPQAVNVVAHSLGATNQNPSDAVSATFAEWQFDSPHSIFPHKTDHTMTSNPARQLFPIRC
jgi:hypothetical protein